MAVDHVTRRDDETYEEFVERTAQNEIARTVKLADLEDNMDIRRLEILTAKDQDRIARYHRAWMRLSNAET